MTYQRYTFTTYKRECDILNEYDPNIKTKNGKPKTSTHSNRPMKRLPVPTTPTTPPSNINTKHQRMQTQSISMDDINTPSPSPSPKTPATHPQDAITDQLELKIDDTEHLKTQRGRGGRLRAGTIDIGYLPTKRLDFTDWIIEVKIEIQKKCLDLLLQWIDNYWIEDFDKNEKNHQEIIELLTEFISDIKKSRDQFQNLSQSKKKKKNRNRNKNRNKNGGMMDDKNKSHHKIYASFLQQYILKLENIIATQQSWYQPIVKQLRSKQQEQEKLYNQQIQNSKRDKRNRLNSHYRNSSTSALSAFSDNIFGDMNDINLMDAMDDDDEDKSEEEEAMSPRLKIQLNDNRSNSIRAFKPRISHSRSGTGTITDVYNNRRISASLNDDDNGDGGDNMYNSLSFIAMKNHENAEEYAKQLTLLDWESFITIDPRTCLYKILKKKQAKKWLAVKLFIDRFQQTHQYVIVSIVAAPDLKARIEMIEFFMFVAETLLKLNNLYSFMAVCTALDSVNVQKLKIAWELVNTSLKQRFVESLSPLCSARNNYRSLRDHCKSMKPPGIPFLGVLLKDLTFTNDGNKNKLSKKLDRHINFEKYRLFYRILSQNITYFHSATYSQNLQHSKQFETQDINSLVQSLNVYLSEDEKEEVFTDEDMSPRGLNVDSDSANMTTPTNGPISYKVRIDNVDGNKKTNNNTECKEVENSKSKSASLDNDIMNNMSNSFMRINIIPDEDFQGEILKDLNSYILLNKNVIRALTMDANRLDVLKKDEYILEYLRPSTNATNSNKRTSQSLSKTGSKSHVKTGSDSIKKVSFKGGKNALKKLFLGSQNSNTQKNQSLSIVKE